MRSLTTTVPCILLFLLVVVLITCSSEARISIQYNKNNYKAEESRYIDRSLNTGQKYDAVPENIMKRSRGDINQQDSTLTRGNDASHLRFYANMNTSHTPSDMTAASTPPHDASSSSKSSCIFEVYKYRYRDVTLTNTCSNGQTLTVDLLDINTDKVIGRYGDVATYFGGVLDDCIYHGTYSFDLLADNFYKNQIMIQGTCAGVADTIIGGVGAYACAEGLLEFDDSQSDEFGYIYVHAFGAGSCGKCKAQSNTRE